MGLQDPQNAILFSLRKRNISPWQFLGWQLMRLWKAADASRRKKVWKTLENPAESMLWDWDGIGRVKTSSINAICCYCRYGRPSRKRTRWRCNFPMSEACSLMCNHVEHKQQLRGYNQQAECNWTKIANSYPRRLAMEITKCQTKAIVQ